MTTDRDLLERAVTTLLCAMAFDEAWQAGASAKELNELRGHWVGDAEAIIDAAEELGLLDDGLGDDWDDDDDGDDFDEQGSDADDFEGESSDE